MQETNSGSARTLKDMEELARSRMRYADLYDFSPVGYVSLNERKEIEEINLTGGRLLGKNPQHLVGRSFLEFVVREDTPKVLDHFRLCRESRQKLTIEVRLRDDEAEETYAELYTMVTRDVDRHT